MQQKFNPTLTTFQVLPHPLRPAASWPLEGQWPPAAARRNWGDRLWQLKIRARRTHWSSIEIESWHENQQWKTCINNWKTMKHYLLNSVGAFIYHYFFTFFFGGSTTTIPTAAKAVVSQSAGGCLRAFARPFTWRSLPRVACLQISPWIIYRQVLRPDR